MTQQLAEQIRDGAVSWNIQGNSLFVNGVNVSLVPYGWSAPITGREDSYHAAMESFR
ncbi:MAG: hypothetical protein FWE02_03955 [Defluviitaleaceae bacterium]|nr:hypothetical protein [Defluviitaleaceae bacterium]